MKRGALRSRAFDQPPLGKNHRPGEHAESDEQEKRGFGDRTGLKDEINDFAADKGQQDGRKMHRFREAPLVEIIDQCGSAVRRGYRIRQCVD
jgi:hypothetical protein